MTKHKELKATQLQSGVPEEFFRELPAAQATLNAIPGQERALRALSFGLRIKNGGYHIYMSGPNGTGRLSSAKNQAEALAKLEPVPKDWCYVYNFDEPRRPRALSFAPGLGRQFRDDMCELVETLQDEMQRVFASETYERRGRSQNL